ncbi:MAG: hypothetical protein WDA20_04545 [Desulfuromonadales bacterium]
MDLQGTQVKEEVKVKFHMTKEGFFVGQEGEFLIHDSRKMPIERVKGKIVSLMEGDTSSLYAMLQTDRGVRPGRLL